MAKISVLYSSCTCKNLESKSEKSIGGEVATWWNHVKEFQTQAISLQDQIACSMFSSWSLHNSHIAVTVIWRVSKITHGRQRIVTSSPDEMLDFIRHSQLPNAVPKLPIWYRIRATYILNRCTWNQSFESSTGREKTWWSVCPYDSIRGSFTTEGDA